MPTLVKLPEMGQHTITQTAEYEKPSDQSMTLWLAGATKQVYAGVQKQQEDNAKRDIALGMADTINGTQREVSWMARANYEQGTEMQKVTSTRARDQTEFVKRIASMPMEGKTEEEINEYGKEFLRKQVDSIYYSNLTPAHKELLYEAGLNEASTYTKSITEAMKNAAEYKAREASTTRVQAIYQAINTLGEQIAPETVHTAVEGLYKLAYTSSFEAGKTAEEAGKTASGEVAVLFDYFANMFTPDQTANIKLLESLRVSLNTMDDSGILPFEVRNGLQVKYNELRSKVQDSNSLAVNNALVQVKLNAIEGDPKAITAQVVDLQGEVGKLVASGAITGEAGYQVMNATVGVLTETNNRALQGMYTGDSILSNNISLQQYIAGEQGGEASYSGKIFSSIVKANINDNVAIGTKALDRALSGNATGEYLPTLATEGVRMLSNQFVGFMSQDPAKAAKNPNYQNAVNAWNVFSQMYNQARVSNGTLAAAMLSGLPSESIDIIRNAAESNYGLHAATDAMANPVAANAKIGLVTKAVTDLSVETLDSRFFGNSLGGMRIWKGMSKPLRNSFLENTRTIYKSSTGALADGATDSDPEKLYARAIQKGLHVQGEYSDTMFSEASIGYYGNIKHNGMLIPKDIIAKSSDDLRREVAKQANTIPDNVLIYSPNPNTIVVQAYDKEGKVKLNVGGSTWVGRVYTQAEFTKRLKDKFDAEGNKYSGKIRNDVTFRDAIDNKANIKSIQEQDRINRQRWAANAAAENAGTKGLKYNPSAYVGTGIAGKTPVKISASHTVAFGGDIQLATAWNLHKNNYEGFVGTLKTAQGAAGGDKSSTNIGHGLSWTFNPKWRAKIEKASGNPQAIIDLEGEFFAASGSQQHIARKVGIPVANSTGLYDKRFVQTQLLIADFRWHSSEGSKSIEKILSQPNYSQALTELKKSASYKHRGNEKANDSDRRNIWRRNALRSFYEAKGLL